MIEADYFDGRSARARRVRLSMIDRQLHVDGDGVALQVPIDEIEWAERTRHGPRLTRLRSGGSLQALDGPAWDAWLRETGIAEPLVVRLQQNWRAVAFAIVLTIVMAGAGYVWGVPWAARAVVALVPASVDRRIGDDALGALEGRWLLPSTLPAERQRELATRFEQALARAYPGSAPQATLLFRTSPPQGSSGRTRLGPNAFALPGGTIVVTDDLVKLLGDRDTVLLGVLGHELGHVRQRHGMRQIVQVSLLGAATSMVLGDFSSVLAAAPALLGQMAYSRDLERDADAEAAHLLRANGIAPAVMAELFDLLDADRPASAASDTDLGIAFASHPRSAERARYFRDQAR